MHEHEPKPQHRFHNVLMDDELNNPENEWFIARGEQAMRDIHLLMMRHDITLPDLALPKADKY